MKYQVEFRENTFDAPWLADKSFSSLGEALEHATYGAKIAPNMRHRIVEVREVLQFPALEDYA